MRRPWLARLAPALNASGAAAERLARVAAASGVVVTTGQQPGLFGGPLYTWAKAFTALAIADALQQQLGVPVAPLFWAATDDADYAEASYTVVALNAEARTVRMPDRDAGQAMAVVPLGDVASQLDMLAHAAGSVIDPAPLDALRHAYTPQHTVGGAYVSLLRAMLEPLGIAVLDAAHPAVRDAAAPAMRRALERAAAVRDALAERSQAIQAAGYRVQVQPVPNLSLVFRTEGGIRQRVPVKSAAALASKVDAAALGPNVLLRPVIERQLLPTVSYVAGPSELAYFAQVSAVADALDLPRPRVVPRWSGVIVEPHVQSILHEIGASVDDFRDPHAIEGRIAREELPATVRSAIAALRHAVETHTATLRQSGDSLPPRSVLSRLRIAARASHRQAGAPLHGRDQAIR